MLAAGFDNLAGEALGDFNCFRNAAPFHHQPRNIRTCPHVASFFHRFNADADRNFFHFRNVFLPLHAIHSFLIVSHLTAWRFHRG